jgi:large subunit ribosomal protein L3
MKAILGLKDKMTQIFDENGVVYPVTVVKTGPITVVQIKTVEKDGYNAVQIGFGERKEKRISKPQLGHFKQMGNFRYLKEFRVSEIPADIKVGDKLDLSMFNEGDKVRISSFSKGKGFQGVVKRHGFKGGPRTHGQKHSEREPGSIGGGGRAGGRVAKGMRMAGRMGNDRVTIKNVLVVSLNPESNEIYLKGAVPGRKGTLVEIQVQN